MNQSRNADQKVPAKAPPKVASVERLCRSTETGCACATVESMAVVCASTAWGVEETEGASLLATRSRNRLARATSSVGTNQLANRGGAATISSKTSPGLASMSNTLAARSEEHTSELQSMTNLV